MAYDKAVDSAVLDAGLTSVADAIRQKGGTSASLSFPQGFVDAIGEISGGEDEPWVRPSDWPDIDALAAQVADDEDCIYLTYDLRKTPGYGWIGIAARNDVANTPWYVERGHVANGAFVADETYTVTSTSRTSNAYFRQALDDADGDVQLWRVRSDDHLLRVAFATNTATNAENFYSNLQPCVERTGKAPYVIDMSSSNNQTNPSITVMGTQWLEHDALVPGKLSDLTNLSRCWENCYSLKKLDVSGWDTSGWTVTKPPGWSYCVNLEELDLSGWDTSSWRLTSFPAFYGMARLRKLNISGWDFSHWTANNWTNGFRYNRSLEELDFTGVTGISSLALTTTFVMFGELDGLVTLKGTDTWTNVTGLTSISVPNGLMLQNFDGIPVSENHSYANASMLTHQSLVNILTVLPTVTAARTITLGQTNKNKLTAEEIAIATAKGWTVA